MRRRTVTRSAALLVGLLSIVSSALVAGTGAAGMSHGPPPARTASAGVADHVDLGVAEDESAHGLVEHGATEARSGTVTAGQVTEGYTARTVSGGGRFDVELDVAPDRPLTLQLRELLPNDAWGETFGYRVYIDGRLVHVRDESTQDLGGGPYHSVFVDTGDRDLLGDGTVTVTIEGTSDQTAHFSGIWAYSGLSEMVSAQGMRVPDHLVFLLGQDYLGEAAFREKLDYITANLEDTDEVKIGFAVLDYFPNRSPAEMAENYRLWLELSREYGLSFAIEGVTDWEGTPSRVPDGKGGFFGDLEYQQILWSPQDRTGPDKDVYTNPAGEVQRLDELLGADYEPRHGLSVPNIWGGTPWLTFNHPDLNAYFEKKANQSLGEIRPFVWDLQHTGEADRLLPFSTTNESVYWSKRNNVGVWDVVYTDYNGGVQREDIYAGLNPHTVAAAAEDGVELDPTDGGWSADEKAWLYQNQSHHQQMFADIFYNGLPRERIEVSGNELDYPDDMLRHNVHSEVYSRMQEPYYSGVYPSITQGIVKRARPGSQFITIDDYNLGGFEHLQKSREFGRIANPNLENSVSTHAPDKTLLLRQLYINGSRYTTPYNWKMTGADEVTNWVRPFLEDMTPWDVVHDASPDGRQTDRKVVSQTFTAGDVRLVDRIDVKLERTGEQAPLRLTVREDAADGRIVGMRYLGGNEIPDDSWASFHLPVVQVEEGRTYHVEIEQLGDTAPAYAYPTSGGDLLHRVGLDMQRERDRSLVIQWRRDAADAIANIRSDLGPDDERARELLDDAQRALEGGHYVEAYESAMKADSMRFPVRYQSSGRAELDPFPLSVESGSTVDVDVRAYASRRRIELAVRGYEPGPATFTARGLTDASVYVDGERIEVTRRGRRAVTFDVDLGGTRAREVFVLAEGEEAPPPQPSEPPTVTAVDTPEPMFGGRENIVSVAVDNTTSEDVPITVRVHAPEGWTGGSATMTVPERQSGQVDVPVTPPAGPTEPATLRVEVLAEGHEVRNGDQEVEVMAVPHGGDVALALDAGTGPVVESYQRLAPEHAWDSERGYGWVGDPPQVRDRGTAAGPARRDFVNDAAARTLRLAVPAGTHDIRMLVGDVSFPSAPTTIRAGGEVLARSGPLEAGEFEWLSFTLDGGPDGREVDLGLSGEPGQHWHLNALVVR